VGKVLNTDLIPEMNDYFDKNAWKVTIVDNTLDTVQEERNISAKHPKAYSSTTG